MYSNPPINVVVDVVVVDIVVVYVVVVVVDVDVVYGNVNLIQ